MIKFNRTLILLVFFCVTHTYCSVFANYSFIDNKGEEIYFKTIEKNASLSQEKAAFLYSFKDNYKNIPPQELRSTFKDFSDVQKWLNDTFEEEEKYFQNIPKVYLISARTRKQDKVIGLIIFEILDNVDSKIVHIRQMSIIPEYQRNNIGTKLLFFIKDTIPNIDEIILDTRKINVKAYQFYSKHGFLPINRPNDSHLDPNKYQGFSLKFSQ